MRNIVKKVSAIALAAIIGMPSAILVHADGEVPIPGGKAGSNAGTALGKAVEIEKELLVFNPSETTIGAPQITYTYTLTAGSADKVITDEDGISGWTIAGVLPAETTKTVVFNNEDITAAAAGASNIKKFSFDFSGVNYPKAGIYRYVITETTDVNKSAAGIEDGTISNTRYLDVYVRDARPGETGRQIYGYVLMTYDNSVDGQTDATVNTEAQAVKTTGFVAATDADGTTELTPDIYKTWNMTIGKTLVNDSAMDTHQFPFTVNFANSGVTQNVKLKATPTGNATAAAPNAEVLGTTTYTPTIANGATVKYIGIPKASSATVYETDDVHGTTYNSSYKIDDGTASAVKPIMENDVSDTASFAEADTTPVDHRIQYTNEFALISPTGLAWRIAPYAAMMIAGICLAMLAKKNRLARN